MIDTNRQIREHGLKIESEYYHDIENGVKKFELRNNDRNFKVGDIVYLTDNVTNKVLPGMVINYILEGPKFGLAEGYCIFCWR